MEKQQQPDLMAWLEQGPAMEPETTAIARDEKEGFDYLPIAHVEAQLDEIFLGLWQTKNFRWQVVANEIIGSIDLEVFNPVANAWITRTGTASVPIQQKSGSAPTDVDAKYKNALVKDFPHLKADCVKNAAKALGRRFGRDLNRNYFELVENRVNVLEQAQGAVEELQRILAEVKTTKELRELLDARPDILKNDILASEARRRRKELEGPADVKLLSRPKR